jgi:hypothetical protein
VAQFEKGHLKVPGSGRRKGTPKGIALAVGEEGRLKGREKVATQGRVGRPLWKNPSRGSIIITTFLTKMVG